MLSAKEIEMLLAALSFLEGLGYVALGFVLMLLSQVIANRK